MPRMFISALAVASGFGLRTYSLDLKGPGLGLEALAYQITALIPGQPK